MIGIFLERMRGIEVLSVGEVTMNDFDNMS